MRQSRRAFLFLVALLSLNSSRAESFEIKMTTNRVHGLLNFVQTIAGHPNRNKIIRETFEKSRYNTPKYRKLIQEFQDLMPAFNQGWTYSTYPNYRVGQSIDKLYLIESGVSNNLEDLRRRTYGLLPTHEQSVLFKILKAFLPVYEKLIFEPSAESFVSYYRRFNKATQMWDLREIFRRASTFYRANWPKELPFIIGLYPIPAKKGPTNGESISNFESMGVLVDAEDFPDRFGVLVHELCHSLYEAQSPEFQSKLENYFRNHPSDYSAVALSMINEGLASAVGNGWAFKRAYGKVDRTEWYAEKPVNDFAKAIYPEVEKYLNTNRGMDQRLWEHLIKKFEETLPDSIYRYDNLMSSVTLITNKKSFNIKKVGYALRDRFRVRSMSRTSPINSPKTIELFKAKKQTTIVLLTPEDIDSLELMSEASPFIKRNYSKIKSAKGSFVLSGRDQGRAILIVVVSGPDEIEKAFDHLKRIGKFQKEPSIVAI